MTKDQEKVLKDATTTAYYKAGHTTVDAIIAAIITYDGLIKPEATRNLALNINQRVLKLQEKADTLTDSREEKNNLVYFKPKGSRSQEDIRIFNSVEEMLSTLSEENHCTIAICDDKNSARYSVDWENAQFLYNVYSGDDGFYHVGDCIGIFDCKTFKKG